MLPRIIEGTRILLFFIQRSIGMRFERKYQITHLSKFAVEQAVRLHPAGFRKIFPNRQVNNIYFDTPDYQTCRANIEGSNQRKKFRLRWYGKDLQTITSPRFEVKIKHNELGRKEIMPFSDTRLADLQHLTEKVNAQFSIYNFQFSILKPTLLNTYQRSYFGTSDGKFRITVDWELQFYPPLHSSAFQQQPFVEKQVILELKYEEEADDLAQTILQYLPFRQTKSSKYVRGVLFGNSMV